MRGIFAEIQRMRFEDVFFSWEEKGATLSGEEMIRLAVLAAAGILLCILGLKIVRAWAAFLGLAAGFAGGAAAAYAVGFDNTAILITGGIAGAVLAFLGAFFYRFGVFLTVFLSVNGICIQILRPGEFLTAGIGLTVALAAAVLAVFFAEALTIFATSVWGGIVAGTSLYQFVPLRGRMVSILLCTIFSVLGILVQMLLESRKRKKKNLEKAAEIRETHSTENEIEKARSLIDEFDRMPENGPASNEGEETGADDF